MFDALEQLPLDPLLGLIVRYRNDSNPNKVDLGVGVYKDAEGKTPVLAAVKQAEQFLLQQEDSKSYVGPAGNAGFNQQITQMLLGSALSAALVARIATIQTPGGCGALRVAAELLQRTPGHGRLWVSNPTWANHIPLLGGAGLKIDTYPYYDFAAQCIDFPAMLDALALAEAGDIVLLHASCHNPSGADLSQEQWQQVISLCAERRLLPLIDVAYQGFGDGLERDAYGARLAASTLSELVLCVSCSKNFGLYRERTGAVVLLAKDKRAAEAGMSHMANVARGLYSMPPSHGASIVEQILGSGELRALWGQELDAMRSRLQFVRTELASRLREKTGSARFDFITREKGMFSFLGISEAQVQSLAERYSIYMASSSRISLAGLNPSNTDYVVDSLLSVL